MIQIAVCDDQKLVSEKIKEMILHGDENRYEVEVFSDGRALLNSGKAFDILFLDIDMPGLDGIETAKALRKSDKKVKIIYITNYGGFAGYAFGVHAFGYLLKPVKEPDIKRQLKEAREYMEKESERPMAELFTKAGRIRIAVEDITILNILPGCFRCIHGRESMNNRRKSANVWKRCALTALRCHTRALWSIWIRSGGYGVMISH